MDRAFIALLFLWPPAAWPGWAAPCRRHAGLALLLCLHLGAVMALFATLPYGKFAPASSAPLAAATAVESASPTPLAWVRLNSPTPSPRLPTEGAPFPQNPKEPTMNCALAGCAFALAPSALRRGGLSAQSQ